MKPNPKILNMKKQLFTLLAILSLFSCKEKSSNNKGNVVDEENKSSSPESEMQNKQKRVLERDTLVAEWAEELEKISLNEKFQVEKELVENRHIKGRMDTIKTFTFRNTSIKVYHTEGLYAVESAEIQNGDFSLKGPVKVGMEKGQLEQVLNTDLNADVIRVGNEVGTFEFKLFFGNNNFLQKIEFEGYVD